MAKIHVYSNKPDRLATPLKPSELEYKGPL